MNPDPGAAGSRAPQRFVDAEGVAPPSSPDGRSGFLSDVIIELGLADAEVVGEAVEEGRLVGKMAGEILVESGAISEEQLAMAIAERNGLPYVDLFRFRVDDGAARLVDSDTARRYGAVPIAFDADGALVVAIADPLDALAVSDIAVITRSEVRVAVASAIGIAAILETLPETKRRPRLSAHGPDGLAGARAAETSGWALMNSISSPEPVPTPDPAPPVDRRPTPTPPPPGPVGPPPPANPAAQLEDRIEAMVASALEKRLHGTPDADGSDEELERAQQQLALERAETAQARDETELARADAARAREQAEQARAEVEALSRRLEQLEGATPRPQAVPPPQADGPPQPPVEAQAPPEAGDSRFSEHLERVMRELGPKPGSA